MPNDRWLMYELLAKATDRDVRKLMVWLIQEHVISVELLQKMLNVSETGY